MSRLAAIFLSLVLLVGPCWPATIIVHGPAVHPAAGGGGDPLVPYLLHETWTPTGALSAQVHSWTGSGTGTIDPDYDVSLLAPGGVANATGQCLRIVSSGTNDKATASFSANATAHVHVLWRYTSMSGTTDIAHLRSGGSIRLTVRSTGAGAITFLHGSASATITDAVPAGEWVHLWFRYTQGTGANGTAECGWSTTSTRPTSGTKWNEIATGGTATTTVNEINLGANATETHTMFFDDVRVDEVGFPQP